MIKMLMSFLQSNTSEAIAIGASVTSLVASFIATLMAHKERGKSAVDGLTQYNAQLGRNMNKVSDKDILIELIKRKVPEDTFQELLPQLWKMSIEECEKMLSLIATAPDFRKKKQEKKENRKAS